MNRAIVIRRLSDLERAIKQTGSRSTCGAHSAWLRQCVAILAFHCGKWSAGESAAVAAARATACCAEDVEQALLDKYHPTWALVLRRLDRLVTANGGRFFLADETAPLRDIQLSLGPLYASVPSELKAALGLSDNPLTNN